MPMNTRSPVATSGIRRKPDPDSRRREICDAAIELLAVFSVDIQNIIAPLAQKVVPAGAAQQNILR